jgi:hypothetical protein
VVHHDDDAHGVSPLGWSAVMMMRVRAAPGLPPAQMDALPAWNRPSSASLFRRQRLEVHMLRGGLLWLLGIPLPIILILFFLGYLH